MNKIVSLAVALLMIGIAAQSLKAEMNPKERIAIIKALKTKGLIGENNKGLVEFRTDDHKAAEVVNEENSYRLKNYKDIAAKTGTSAESVGMQRAKQIVQEDSSGSWHQTQDGTWTQKK